jgi:hypothetical protein
VQSGAYTVLAVGDSEHDDRIYIGIPIEVRHYLGNGQSLSGVCMIQHTGNDVRAGIWKEPVLL